jgi:hypothetical protein
MDLLAEFIEAVETLGEGISIARIEFDTGEYLKSLVEENSLHMASREAEINARSMALVMGHKLGGMLASSAKTTITSFYPTSFVEERVQTPALSFPTGELYCITDVTVSYEITS